MTEGSQQPQLPQLVDIKTLADRLDTTVRHIRGLVADRGIPYGHVGRLLRFDPVEILAWLEEQRQPVTRKRTRG